jgi:hypothetical protein
MSVYSFLLADSRVGRLGRAASVLAVLGLFLAPQPAAAKRAGYVGTPECRDLQLAVQEAVGDEDPALYPKHRSYVRTVKKLIKPHLKAGEVSRKCGSCITKQFKHRVAVADQKPCGPEAAPELAESDPAAGAIDVPRSAWLDLRFAGAVPPALLSSFALACGGEAQGIEAHSVEPARVVVNPAAKLPPATRCELRWAGLGEEEGLAFDTAAAGVPGTVIYDRTDDGRYAPFPDDYFLTPDASTPTGFRVAVPPPTSRPPDVAQLLYRLLNQTDQLDGWSPLVLIQVDLTDAPDPDSLPMTAQASLDLTASVGLFDLTPGSDFYGQRIPFLITLRSDQVGDGPFGHSILIFPSIPLSSGGRYGLVVTDRVGIDASRPFEASSFFQAALGPGAPGEAEPVARVRELATDVLDTIAAESVLPIPADDVALALSLRARTIDDLADDVLAIKEQILAAPPPEFTITRVWPGWQDQFAVVHGTWKAPNWRDGLFLARDGSGQPMQTGTIDVRFTLALPAAIADGPVPAAMYQHGNPGSPAGEVPYSDIAEAGFATFGTLDSLNREIGGTDQQNSTIFGVLQFTGQIADFWTQTRGEQLAFLRLIQSVGEADSVDDLPPGAPPEMLNIDASRIVYEGVSEGGNNGQGFLPYAPEVQAASIIVGGERLTEVMVHQDGTDPDGSGSFFFEEIPKFIPNLRPTDVWTGLSLFQMRFDPQDPHNHARFIYRDPVEVAGTTRKASILVVEGIQDSHVPNNATDSLAWLLGIPQLPPVARRVPLLTVEDAPATANIDAETTAGMVQYVPAGVPDLPPSPGCESNEEGHYCAQSSPVAVQQRQEFYWSAVDDPVPTIPAPNLP